MKQKKCSTKLLCVFHQAKNMNGLLQLMKMKALTAASERDKKKLKLWGYQNNTFGFLWKPTATITTSRRRSRRVPGYGSDMLHAAIADSLDTPNESRDWMEILSMDFAGLLKEDVDAGTVEGFKYLQRGLPEVEQVFLDLLDAKRWELHIGFHFIKAGPFEGVTVDWLHFLELPNEKELRESIQGMESIGVSIERVRTVHEERMAA
jgi:hypothetical protein